MSVRHIDTLRWLAFHVSTRWPAALNTTVSCLVAVGSSSRHAARFAEPSRNNGIVSAGFGGDVRNQLAFESDNATNCTDRPSFFSSVHNDSAIPAWDRHVVQNPSTITTTSARPWNAESPYVSLARGLAG